MKTKLLNLLKWNRTKAVWKIIQLFHVTVATHEYHQVAALRKIKNYLTGSSGLEIWNQQIWKPLSGMSAVTSLLLLPFTAPDWSRFCSFPGLMGLCNIKNLRYRTRSGFKHLRDNKRFFMCSKAFLSAERPPDDCK